MKLKWPFVLRSTAERMVADISADIDGRAEQKIVQVVNKSPEAAIVQLGNALVNSRSYALEGHRLLKQEIDAARKMAGEYQSDLVNARKQIVEAKRTISSMRRKLKKLESRRQSEGLKPINVVVK